MPVRWTPDLSVGVTLIDDQHKELFKRVNQLLEAAAFPCCHRGNGAILSTRSMAMRAGQAPVLLVSKGRDEVVPVGEP
ncbi:MAG: hypothetical protein ACYC3V_20925 [Chloroflexota bacterium]